MLLSTFGYWTACTNCVACIVMALVIQFVFKLTRSAATGYTSIKTLGIKAQTKINTLVTVAHVAVILAYTGLSIMHFNGPPEEGVGANLVLKFRVITAWTMFGGF